LRRTLLTALVACVVVAFAWLRLEQPHDAGWKISAVVVLALSAALWRPAIAVALVLAVRVALGEWPWHIGRAATHFGNGFLDFYDVRTPFDPRVHAEMGGVVLLAIFAFGALLTVAVAERWTLVALGTLLLGAGWPATLSGGDVRTGVGILLGALVVLAGLTTRRVPPVIVPAAAAIVLAAVAASASSAVAKSGVVAWQNWDFYNAPAAPVSVAYVWDADYDHLSWPRKRTRVLEIEAPPRSLFWRAAVLDEFAGDRWLETSPRAGDALEPSRPADVVRQRVHVLALSDTRLVGASVPVAFHAGSAVRQVPGFAQLPSGLTRGFSYSVESQAPRPDAARLRRAQARYPSPLTAFREIWPGVIAPRFGEPRRAFLDPHQDLQRYVPLLNLALEVTAGTHTPYDAAAALVRWFRTTGGFRYTNRPSGSATPLVGFVAETRAGYCQHFAGAMALMLRYLGIPARVAVGFSSGVYDAKRQRWLVSDHDAHAWVEVWFRGFGWLPFDPTPRAGRPERGELSAPYARFTRTTASTGAALLTGAGQNDRSSGHRHGETSSSTARTGRVTAPPSRRRGGSLLALLLLVAGGLAAIIVAAKFLSRRRRYVTRDPRRIAAACRGELADYLLDQGIEGARSATLHELGALVRDELTVDPDAFVSAATAARFGPPDGAAASARAARRELRVLLRSMRRRLKARERARGLFSLRSLGFSA
jgi:transglutaminase-like putative cysteine protease